MGVLTTSVMSVSAGAAVTYLVAPCRLVLLGGYCICDDEVGTIDLTVTNTDTTPVVQMTFDLPATSAAIPTEATVNNTSIFEEGDAIKFNVPAAGAVKQINFVIKYDPFLAGVSGA